MKTYRIIGKKSYYVEVEVEAEDEIAAEKEFLFLTNEDMDLVEEDGSDIENIEEVNERD